MYTERELIGLNFYHKTKIHKIHTIINIIDGCLIISDWKGGKISIKEANFIFDCRWWIVCKYTYFNSTFGRLKFIFL